MRTLTLLILIILCSNIQETTAQSSIIQYPDTIILTKWDVENIFKTEKDTLGFKQLTSKTSLDEYKGEENKLIMRTMRSLKKSMDGSTMYNQIAHKDLVKFWEGYPVREEEIHVLYNVKYSIMKKGVFVLGERSTIAPWNDIITDWKTIECYCIGFDKSVKLVQTFHINRKKRFPTGIVKFLPELQSYSYADSITTDTIMVKSPPLFRDGNIDLKKYFETNTRYPILAIDDEIEGKVIISFTVNPDADITDLRLIRSSGPLLDKELARTIRKTNGIWKPGTINGKETHVEVTIGIQFKLID